MFLDLSLYVGSDDVTAAGLQPRAAGWQGWFSYCNKDKHVQWQTEQQVSVLQMKTLGTRVTTLLYNIY